MTKEEAIRRIKSWNLDSDDMEVLSVIIPELAESEDERIITFLYDFIKVCAWSEKQFPPKKRCLAYLEKQKESLHIPKTCKENVDSFTDENEKIKKALISLVEENAYTYKSFAGVELADMLSYLEQKEQTEELSIRLNGLMQEYVKSGKDEEEQEYRLKCYQLFWDALGDSEFFEQKEQKEIPLMNGDADLYFDEWNQQKQNPTKRQCFEEGIRYAQRLQKEQKPILEVFGFKVGDAVRLKDGDGRKHIIKSFEEVKGIHGPNFYLVEFEDNSARDGIYPGEKYPNGYYTQMEKFEEKQKPISKTEPIVDGLTEFEKQVSYLIASAMDKEHEYSEGYVKWMAQTLMGHAIKNQKPVWSDIDKGILKDAITAADLLGNNEDYKKEHPHLAKAFRIAKNWLEHLPERLSLQPKQEWSEDYNEENIQTRFAFYTYKDDPSTLYLSNVFVEEASRNHGFGTKILRAAEKVAETLGATTISLKVKRDSPANDWYRKNGYGYVTFEGEYDWRKKNLEYLKPKKEVEWSKEDEEIFNLTITHLLSYAYPNNPIYRKEVEKCVTWFKSLKNRGISPKSNTNSQNAWSDEDEWARNYLIEHLINGMWIGEESERKLVTWLKSLPINLEKQKEQKPLPKFKVGDTIHCKYDDREFTIKSVDLTNMVYKYTKEGCGNDIDYADEDFELVEQKPAERSETKINGEPISTENNSVDIPLVEWSEEDRLHYANVLEALEYVKGCKSDYDKIEAVKSDIAWLKSLRPPQYCENCKLKRSVEGWKSSEEQIEAFRSYIKDFQEKAETAVGGWNNFDVMIQLFEQLQKLK